MSILPVGAALPLATPALPSAAPAGTGFAARIESALDQLSQSQDRATQSARAWELGLQNDLAAVMVDQQVASLGFQLTLNVRNKALGAYRDIMNMPL